MCRGYFGVGIVDAKTPANVGTLWRTAHAFDASFIFTVGQRYPSRYAPTDTSKADRHVPLYAHRDVDVFLRSRPAGASLVGVEFGDHLEFAPVSLFDFEHPERAVYVLGAEDRGLPRGLQRECDSLVFVPSAFCLNVAVVGSMVLYDRAAKMSAERRGGAQRVGVGVFGSCPADPRADEPLFPLPRMDFDLDSRLRSSPNPAMFPGVPKL